MNPQAVFGLQFVLSLVMWGLIAKWLLVPWLDKLSQHEVLFYLTLPHAFRYMGLVFLVPGVVAPSISDSFATAAAYGDLATGLLALLALIALRSRWAWALPLVWFANIVGTVDLINAVRQQNVVPDLGAAWYIPSLFVPLLLVSHVMIFARLLRSAP